jgi:CHAD domain-containing protein
MKSRFPIYFRQTSQSLFNSWLENSSHPTESGLHDLRVLLKKSRFCQYFLAWVYGKSALGKLPEHTRLVFRESGMIRELQLMRKWLTTEKIDLLDVMQCSTAIIDNKLLQLQKKLLEHHADVSKGIKKAEQLAEKTHPILSDQYWQQLNSGLKKQLKKPKKKDWHELRKLIKKWTYALNCLQDVKSPSKPLIQAMQNLEKNIGDWHEYWMIGIRLEEKEPGDTDSFAFRTQYALAKTRIQEQMEVAEKKTERQLKKVAELL